MPGILAIFRQFSSYSYEIVNLLQRHHDNKLYRNETRLSFLLYAEKVIYVFLLCMKLFTFIMAVMFLVLSGMPCRDNDSLENTALTASAQHHADQKGHKDACSPFCTCSCCSTLSISYPLAVLAAIHVEASVHCSSLYIGSVINISLPVWQPPQLTA